MIAKKTRRVVPLAVMLWTVGCSPDERGSPEGPNVVFIVVDTLRADRLPMYGHDKNTTPFLQGLAAQSVLFERAWSTSTWTAPATASLFTSLLPAQHGVLTGHNLTARLASADDQVRLNRIPEDIDTLPETMQELGYRTFGIADNPNIRPELGFASGFDSFVSYDYKTARVVNQQLEDWKDEIRSEGKYFLYLHYMEPHVPYHKRRPWYGMDTATFNARSGTQNSVEEDRPDPLEWAEARQLLSGLEDEHLEQAWEEIIRRLFSAYDSEIRYLDDKIREVFEMLEIGEDTVVVITSDHGEEFMDHGRVGHVLSLYNELMHVPLMIRAPGYQPVRVRPAVSVVDILPTLVDLLGYEPSPDGHGVSLANLMGGAPAAERPIVATRTKEFAEPALQQKKAFLQEPYKLILTAPEDTAELYHLQDDPEEQHDLSAEDSTRVQQMRQALAQLEEQLRVWERSFVDVEFDEDTIEMLKRLGYADR